MNYQISIVTITKDNSEELLRTLNSISALECPVEIVIIDGSERDNSKLVYNAVDSCHNVLYERAKPEGIYQAQNKGISMCSANYILVLNAGDTIINLSSTVFSNLTSKAIYVFGQEVRTETGQKLGEYYYKHPKMFPHQSIIVPRSLFEEYGFYPLKYRYNAEQIWLVTLKNAGVKFYFYNFSISCFYLGGISSTFNFGMFRENYIYYRLQNVSVANSIIISYIKPVMRHLMSGIPRKYFLTYLKKNV